MNSKIKKWVVSIIVVLVLAICGGIFWGSNYLVTYAFQRKQNKMDSDTRIAQTWLVAQKPQIWYQKAVDSDLKLQAYYLPAAKKTNKTIIIAHGWRESGMRMARYVKLYHELGYNVLAPDDRGLGKSEGKYLTFGWLDRLDYVKWAKQVVKKIGSNSEIGLFGVSMGGATVMMASGEKLPSQVKAIIEDCGYSSVGEELSNEIQDVFNLPKEPLITTSSWVARYRIGYDFLHASSVEQLKKNKLPILFIHGDDDKFVQTYMVYKNYHATKGPKELWITKNTAHAKSYKNYPVEYRQKVSSFFAKYLH